jgi:hypothetical protein
MSIAEPFHKDRKTTKIRLSTGQRIELTVQEERMLKIAYDFLSGYSTRSHKEHAVDKKKEEVAALYNNLPTTARVSLRDRSITAAKKGPGELSLIEGNAANSAANNNNNANNNANSLLSDSERKLEEYLTAKGELMALEEDLKTFVLTDHKISIRDLDAAIRNFGAHVGKKELEQMIWEVDENSDGVIDYEEFQLTYFRNITDATGSEPCAFFQILEVHTTIFLSTFADVLIDLCDSVHDV